MTAVQLRAELFREMNPMLDSEEMLKKMISYVRNLAKKLQTPDPTLMTEEEFFARIDEAEKGPRYKMLPDESLDDMLIRLGYV